MRDTVLFWGFALLVGILALPPAGFLFARLPGQGLALARPLGLLLLGYPVWLLASVDAVPYREWSPFLGLALLALLAAAIWIAAGRPLPGHPSLRLWLAGEAIFTVAFFSWALLRSFAPDVWNTEKPMDMAFVNAVNRSEWFPPHDPWMSGESLNYYYYGHYVVAVLVRATDVDPSSGFNLAVALFYALTASALFAVASALAYARRSNVAVASLAGVTTVVVALVLGNLAGATELLNDPRPLAQYDWWSPSRVIDGTANEFPFFSYLLGDLHAHVMATPFALMAIGLSLQLALAGPRPATRGRGLALAAGELLLAGLVVGSLYAINSLDFPTALALVLGGAALWFFRAEPERREWRALAWPPLVAAAGVALFAPFIVRYVPDTEGIALVRQHDPFTRFAVDIALIYALSLWIVGPALAHRLAVPRRYIAWSAVGILVVLVALAPQRVAGLFLVGALAAVALHAALDRRLIQPERFFWLLVSAGLILVAVGEFAYIRDVFEGTVSFRFNTVFKAGYQAWFLLALAAGCGLVWAGGWLRRPVLRAWAVGVALLGALLAIYPVAGSYARTNGFSNEPTLTGDRWLSMSQPGDAAAIRWLRTNVSGSPTILEAFGPDFSQEGHARVSTFTGLPSVIGWAGHELQWGHDPGSRPGDVRLAYSTLDLAVARRLLAGYGVRYVVVGSLESAAYPAEGLAKFDRLGRRVYERGGTIVYELPLPPNADG